MQKRITKARRKSIDDSVFVAREYLISHGRRLPLAGVSRLRCRLPEFHGAVALENLGHGRRQFSERLQADGRRTGQPTRRCFA